MSEIITCTGYGFTGSSVATNIIEEFANTKSLGAEFECTLLHEVDGIRDLEKALCEGHRLKCDLAIKRFLRLADILNRQHAFQKYFNGNFLKHTNHFIDSIIVAQWNGNWHRGAESVRFSKEDLLYYNLAKQVFLNEYSYSRYSLFEPDAWHPTYRMKLKSYYAVFDDTFYIKVQSYINQLIEEISVHIDTKRILIDQFFPAYDIASYLNYAPNTKIIIVDRDPRDMYVLNKSFWAEPYIPTDDVNTFIKWYKGIRSSQKKERENENVAFFHFEDFIFNYETSLIRLKQFLNLTDVEHVKKQQYFTPAKSIKNTYKFKNYPQWEADILKIEKELADYCYNFPDDLLNNICIDKNEPIETYINRADRIKTEKKLPMKYKKNICKFLFGMTNFGEAWESLAHRKVLKTKIKGIVKCLLFFPVFLIEYPYIIFMYYTIARSRWID